MAARNPDGNGILRRTETFTWHAAGRLAPHGDRVVEPRRDLQSSNRALSPPLPREGRGGRGVRGPPAPHGNRVVEPRRDLEIRNRVASPPLPGGGEGAGG